MTEPLGNLDALTAALPAQPQPQSLSSGASPPPLLQPQPEAGPSRLRAADKWLKPHGPPVGVAFGARLLGEEEDVWSQNAWDHVELPDDFNERAEEIMERHRSSPVSSDIRDDYNERPAWYWNKFYSNHKEAFFKDRSWLRLEFPELVACTEADAGPKVCLEVGCGAGNTVYPLLAKNENPELVIHATDYSAEAVGVVKANSMYPKPAHGKGIIHASVWDITSKPLPAPSADGAVPPRTFSLPEGVEPGTVDVLTVIYVLSALHPTEWDQAIHNLYSALKPGGLLLIRDYGRHDLAQLRIKKDRLLDPAVPNLYIRGDGTRVYFFTKQELRGMLEAAPRASPRVISVAASKEEDPRDQDQDQDQGSMSEQGSMFEVNQLGEDRRLLVNRKERLKMYRIWMQVKARKLGPNGEGATV